MISLGIPLTGSDLVEHINMPSSEAPETCENALPLEDPETYESMYPIKNPDEQTIIADLRNVNDRISELKGLIENATTKEMEERLKRQLEYAIWYKE
jgi:hypothetical protein